MAELPNLKKEKNEISGNCYIKENGKYNLLTKHLTLDDFLCNPTETHYEKYGNIIEEILKHI